jgi:hypothetical protein
MIVAFVWPNCNFRLKTGTWSNEPKHAFFVGFSQEELAKHFPDEKWSNPSPEYMEGCRNKVYMLIAFDLSFAERSTWHYPIDNLWNGYSPFRNLGQKTQCEIKDLKELEDLINFIDPVDLKGHF